MEKGENQVTERKFIAPVIKVNSRSGALLRQLPLKGGYRCAAQAFRAYTGLGKYHQKSGPKRREASIFMNLATITRENIFYRVTYSPPIYTKIMSSGKRIMHEITRKGQNASFSIGKRILSLYSRNKNIHLLIYIKN